MTRTANRILQVTLAIGAGLCVLVANDRASLTDPDTLVTQAQARVGRPLTPMSYAGVARRTTRRTVYGAAAVGAAGAAAYGAYGYAAPVVVEPSCYQAVDAYGRIYTRC